MITDDAQRQISLPKITRPLTTAHREFLRLIAEHIVHDYFDERDAFDSIAPHREICA